MLASLAGDTPGADAPETSVGGEDDASRPKCAADTLRVILDKKGRKGKVATIIEGFTIPDDEVAEISSELKRKIGTGGSARGGEILLQGDWREKASSLLREKGFKVK